jgi:DNA-binding PadR family transcriptional regulator
MPDEIADLGRFAEPSLLILASLGEHPKHGYAIMTDIERLTGTSIGPGTLYAALARLESRGLIEPLPSEERRRPYRLTGSGAAVLEVQLDRLDAFVRIGQARLSRQRAPG